MTPAETELLTILVEEAAEVIQAGTKILRFGLEGETYPDGTTKLNKLIEEWADLQATVDLLQGGPNFGQAFVYAKWHQLKKKKCERIAHWTSNDWLRVLAITHGSLHERMIEAGADR